MTEGVSFIRELELAKEANLLSFTVMQMGGAVAPASIQSMGANNYLGYLRDFQLTPLGHGRARSRVYERETPDPGEDDGKPITRLTFERITEILAAAYDELQLESFLLDSGVPQDMIPPLVHDGGGLADLFALFNGGDSNSRGDAALRLRSREWAIWPSGAARACSCAGLSESRSSSFRWSISSGMGWCPECHRRRVSRILRQAAPGASLSAAVLPLSTY